MSNETIIDIPGSRPDWSDLEDWVRIKVQDFIQDILEEEVTEFLGRGKSERRKLVDARPGYRNGYCKERKLTLSAARSVCVAPRFVTVTYTSRVECCPCSPRCRVRSEI